MGHWMRKEGRVILTSAIPEDGILILMLTIVREIRGSRNRNPRYHDLPYILSTIAVLLAQVQERNNRMRVRPIGPVHQSLGQGRGCQHAMAVYVINPQARQRPRVIGSKRDL